MPASDELLAIIERILSHQHTAADLAVLREMLNSGGQQELIQLGKYNNYIEQGRDVQIGDRIYYGTDAQAIREIVRQELQIPIPSVSTSSKSVDELVQQVRSRLHDDIQRLHGTMPLVGVSHWVDLGELFVDVNILQEVSSDRKSELSDLWQDFTDNVKKYSSDRSLDRIGLGQHQKRVSGLEVLGKNKNLMVLGKPGSGKTTYLQRIVSECNQGKLQPHRIPVLIKIRHFRTDGRKFEYNLQRYLTQEWRLDEVEIENVLSQGRALILLDGLDEVTGADGREISKNIKLFARIFPHNQLIVTCRTQGQESKFERFDYVEVADFNEAQVKAFVEHWFQVFCQNIEKGQAKTKQFLEKLYLSENKPIRELAITPILLSLTCAVFQQTGKFYSKRSKLYEEGLELLLENWDKSREIEREEIYRDLSVKRKLELLSYLAVKKFEQQQYVLFEQEEIEGYIAELLEISQRDSRLVLKAIEAQHGLLIERAQKVWSFSHLTFQEYLVTRQILAKCNPLFIYDPVLNYLVSYLTDKRWREVFLLAVIMLDRPDILFCLMKAQVDELLAKNDLLQRYLIWVNQKSQAVDAPYKPAAIRAFYFSNFDLKLMQEIDSTIIIPSDILIISLKGDIYIDYNLQKALDSSYLLNQDIQQDPEGHPTNNQALYYSSDHLYGIPIFCVENSPHSSVIIELYKYNPHVEWEKFKEWWLTKGQMWAKSVSSFMRENRNIGHDWQFTEEEYKLLQQYGDANKLLANCLYSNCNISLEVKQEIEDTLILPIAELEKRKREKKLA